MLSNAVMASLRLTRLFQCISNLKKMATKLAHRRSLFSDKAEASSGKEELKIIQQDHSSIAPDYCGLPYIIILVDLGLAKSSFEAQVDSSNDMCLWIYAKGHNAKMYSFL